MRAVSLVRHGHPDMPYDNPRCIGTTDLGLSTLGRLQSVLAGVLLRAQGVSTVFCSRLSRSIESAVCMGYEPVTADGLQELHAGDWDGLHFDEIRAKWPKLYEERGLKPWTPPPGAEDAQEGALRFEAAVRAVLARSNGDIAIVTHTTVTGLFICRVLGLPHTKAREFKTAYGSVTKFSFDGEHFILCGQPGIIPLPVPDETVCTALLRAAATPPRVVSHCGAVANEALRICDELSRAGFFLDRERVRAAAMLHDILRTEPRHAAAGADLIARLGYPDVADCIKFHHDCEFGGILDEAAILYIADKLVQGDRPVALETRFAESLKKCRTGVAVKKHKARLETARAIRTKINSLCERDVIL